MVLLICDNTTNRLYHLNLAFNSTRSEMIFFQYSEKCLHLILVIGCSIKHIDLYAFNRFIN